MESIVPALAIYLVLSLPSLALLWAASKGTARLPFSRRQSFLAFLLIAWALLVPGVMSTGMFHVFAPMILAWAVSCPVMGWHAFLQLQRVYGLVPAVGTVGMLMLAGALWRKQAGRRRG